MSLNNTRGDFASAEKIASAIKKEILEIEHLTCSVGIGPNKLVAKMAVDSRKPDGLTTNSSGSSSIVSRSVASWEAYSAVGPKTEEKLGAMGIKTVGRSCKLQ